jgi:hypothetical protein
MAEFLEILHIVVNIGIVILMALLLYQIRCRHEILKKIYELMEANQELIVMFEGRAIVSLEQALDKEITKPHRILTLKRIGELNEQVKQ